MALKKGLTAVETLVVVGIVGGLASAVTFGLGQKERATAEAAKTQLAELGAVIDDFASTEGRLPRHLGELIDNELVEPSDTLDPWGRAFRYRKETVAQQYNVCSRGPDGAFSTDDDLCSDGD